MGRQRIPARTPAERDTASPWRRKYTYLLRAGIASFHKRQMRRRERRTGKVSRYDPV